MNLMHLPVSVALLKNYFAGAIGTNPLKCVATLSALLVNSTISLLNKLP